MWKTRYLFIAILLVFSVAGVQADVRVYLDHFEYVDESDVWEYTYALENSTQDFWVYMFSLEPVDMVMITGSPIAWTGLHDTAIGGSAIWFPDGSDDYIGPGETLSGFILQSPYGPSDGHSEWWAGAEDRVDDGTPQHHDYYGSVPGAHVPEPGSLLLIAVGIGGLMARRLSPKD